MRRAGYAEKREGVPDRELEPWKPHEVVGVCTIGELQGTLSQPLQHATELTTGAGVRSDTADKVHTCREGPVVPTEDLSR